MNTQISNSFGKWHPINVFSTKRDGGIKQRIVSSSYVTSRWKIKFGIWYQKWFLCNPFF